MPGSGNTSHERITGIDLDSGVASYGAAVQEEKRTVIEG